MKKVLLALSTVFFLDSAVASSKCTDVFQDNKSSYLEVLDQMEKDPYVKDDLPVLPLTLFKTMLNKVIPNFFVATRSKEILQEKKDFRLNGQPKPVHPMGVGFEGVLQLRPTRWSGAFRGGVFPVLARASISQGNPYKQNIKNPEKSQPRSTAMAIKIFPTNDLGAKQKTANIVFQNDLNGQVKDSTTAINWLEADQTNQPALNVLKIRHFYEVATLIGVAHGALSTKTDRVSKFPYINPQIRPVHSLAEMNEVNPEAVKTPVWVMIRPSKEMTIVERDDFREELAESSYKNGELVFEFYAADSVNSVGQKNWEHVGRLKLANPILSRGVDQNILFPHDTMVSLLTGKEIVIPSPDKRDIPLFDDVQ